MDKLDIISSDEEIDTAGVKREKRTENSTENSGEYFCSKKFSDVKIHVDGNEVHAHKVILAGNLIT